MHLLSADEKYFRQAKRVAINNRTTGIPIEGCFAKINDCTLDHKVEFDDFKLAGENVARAKKSEVVEVSFSLGNYSKEFLELLTNGTVTDYTSSGATGEATDLANVNGDSVYDAATGIASITITDEDVIEDGEFVIECTAAAKVVVYFLHDLFTNTTTKTFISNKRDISAELTITTATPTAVTGWGFSLTGGSGTIGMEVGDTARFLMRKPNTVGEKISVDCQGTYEEVEILLFPDKYNDEFSYIKCFRTPIGGNQIKVTDSFSTQTLTMTLLQDDSTGLYYDVFRNRPE